MTQSSVLNIKARRIVWVMLSAFLIVAGSILIVALRPGKTDANPEPPLVHIKYVPPAVVKTEELSNQIIPSLAYRDPAEEIRWRHNDAIEKIQSLGYSKAESERLVLEGERQAQGYGLPKTMGAETAVDAVIRKKLDAENRATAGFYYASPNQ